MIPEDKYLWITASCYFPIDKWHLLLMAISAFWREIDKQDAKTLQIAFDYTNEDNLRLSILVRNEAFDTLLAKTDDYFASFFSDYPNESIKAPITGIHLPFPSAIARIDRYSLSYNQNEFPTYQLHEEISHLIIEVLGDGEIDNDTITTFYSYLQIALLKVCLNKLVPASKAVFIDKGKDNLNSKALTVDNISFNSLYEITCDIMEVNQFDDELIWLNRWVDLNNTDFDKALDKMLSVNVDEVFAFYEKRSIIISKQLCINEKINMQLSQIIFLSFQKLDASNSASADHAMIQ